MARHDEETTEERKCPSRSRLVCLGIVAGVTVGCEIAAPVVFVASGCEIAVESAASGPSRSSAAIVSEEALSLTNCFCFRLSRRFSRRRSFRCFRFLRCRCRSLRSARESFRPDCTAFSSAAINSCCSLATSARWLMTACSTRWCALTHQHIAMAKAMNAPTMRNTMLT